MLGIKLDSNIQFENNVTNLCIKATEKLQAPATNISYMDLEIWQCLIKALIMYKEQGGMIEKEK